MRRILTWLLVLLVIGGGTAAIWFATRPAPPSVETTTPTAGTDVNTLALNTTTATVTAEGRIVPAAQTDIAFQIGGQIAHILVAEGDMVAEGEPLVRLDDTDQQLALQQAQAGLVQARANVQTAVAAQQQAQVGLATAELGITSAEVQLALLAADPTATQIALQESQLAIAQAAVNQAAGNRSAALEGATTAEIRAAEAQVQAAQAAVQAAQTARDQLGETASDSQRTQAQLQLNAAVANRQAAEARLAELRAGATAAQQQTANAGVGTAVAQQEAAEANFNLFLAGARAEQIAIAEIGVAQAEQAVVLAELAVRQAEQAVAQAENGVAEAEAAVATAEANVAKTVLVAPLAGTVARLEAKLGQVVSPAVPLITIADLSQWQVETVDLSELGVVSIAVGYPVQVTVDAFPDESIPGTITEIARTASLFLGDVTYTVTIALQPTPLPLRWGMTTFVTVENGEN